MSTVSTLTTQEIDSDFRLQLEGITPRYQTKQASKFVYYGKNSSPGWRTRRYTTRFSNLGENEEGLMGLSIEEVIAEYVVTVDYGSVPDEEIEQIAGDDHMVMKELFYSRVDPILPGLMDVRSGGWEESEESSEEIPQIDHTFEVIFMQERFGRS